MKREIITIGENGKVHIPTAPVWMSACEKASLFGGFSGKVNSHIKSVFKEGLLREDEVMQTLLFKGGAVDLYNIEMIMMLSYWMRQLHLPTLKTRERYWRHFHTSSRERLSWSLPTA